MVHFFLIGTGFGLMTLTFIGIITEWFDTKLSFATGLAGCGVGLGIAVFAFLNDWLVDSFGWKGAMLILSSMMSLCILLSVTFVSPKNFDNSEKSRQSKEPLDQWDKFKMAIKETLNFKAINEPLFAYFILANVVSSVVYFIPLVITQDRINRLGYGTKSGALLTAMYGVANGVAKTMFGYLFDFPCVNRVLLYGFSFILLGLVVAGTNFATSLLFFQILYCLFGMIEGKCKDYCAVVQISMSNKLSL